MKRVYRLVVSPSPLRPTYTCGPFRSWWRAWRTAFKICWHNPVAYVEVQWRKAADVSPMLTRIEEEALESSILREALEVGALVGLLFLWLLALSYW